MGHTYEVFVGMVGAVLLTRGIWLYLKEYAIGPIIIFVLGILLLFFKDRIIKRVPNWGMFSDTVQSRVLGIISGLLIGYSIWEYSQPYIQAHTLQVIGISLFIILFQKPIASIIPGNGGPP